MLGLTRKHGQCEKVKGYSLQVVKTQTQCIKSVSQTTVLRDKSELKENWGLSTECVRLVDASRLSLECIASPLECTTDSLCYAYPNRRNCFCQDPNSPECKALKVCRRGLADPVESVDPKCTGRHILDEHCPCSLSILRPDCSCTVFPRNPGCPCDRDPNSLVCRDLLRTAEIAQLKTSLILTEASRATKVLRGG